VSLSRRHCLLAFPSALLLRGQSQKRFRLAICSETFAGADFAGICKSARRSGFSGLEVDPANLGEDPAALSADRRKEVRAMLSDAGLIYVGMHSFLKTPKGMHLTTPDNATRQRTLDYFARLLDLSADLGSNSVMVLGSSKQRSAVAESSVADATARLEEGLGRLSLLAAQREVTILLEPLSPQFTNVVNTLAASRSIVERIGSRGLATMFDTHNTTAETEPASVLIAKHLKQIRHVHLNEMDGRYPGSGNYLFRELLQALRDNEYKGWLSVELFDFQPDGETVASKSAAHIRELERTLDAETHLRKSK